MASPSSVVGTGRHGVCRFDVVWLGSVTVVVAMPVVGTVSSSVGGVGSGK